MSNQTENIGLLIVPTKAVLDARKQHQLQYRNNRFYDYTYSDFALIPHCINEWAANGLDLSPEFIENIWQQHATRRPEHQRGEQLRTEKLVLDALRGLYDYAAFADYANCLAFYSPSEDMAGQDLLLHVPDVGPVWVQLSVRTGESYLSLKEHRRNRRGIECRTTFNAVAFDQDLDCEHQPWLPTPSWYVGVVDQIILEQRQSGYALTD